MTRLSRLMFSILLHIHISDVYNLQSVSVDVHVSVTVAYSATLSTLKAFHYSLYFQIHFTSKQFLK